MFHLAQKVFQTNSFLSTRHGVLVSYKKSDADTSESILFLAKTSKFTYHGDEINSDIFDVLLLDDIAKRSKFFSPGYLSSGGKPCEFDTMTEEQLRSFGMKKSSCGFAGTIRCYIERNRGGNRCLCFDSTASDNPDSDVFHLYREDSKEYIMSAVAMPGSSNVAFFKNPNITASTVTAHIYDEDYLGVMKGNGLGTEFILYDNGLNPALIPECVFEENQRNQVLRITYKSNIAGRQPNSMQVFAPATVETEIERMSDREKRIKSFTNRC